MFYTIDNKTKHMLPLFPFSRKCHLVHVAHIVGLVHKIKMKARDLFMILPEPQQKKIVFTSLASCEFVYNGLQKLSIEAGPSPPTCFPVQPNNVSNNSLPFPLGHPV